MLPALCCYIVKKGWRGCSSLPPWAIVIHSARYIPRLNWRFPVASIVNGVRSDIALWLVASVFGLEEVECAQGYQPSFHRAGGGRGSWLALSWPGCTWLLVVGLIQCPPLMSPVVVWSHDACPDFITMYTHLRMEKCPSLSFGLLFMNTIGIRFLATEGSGLVDNAVGGEKDRDTQLRFHHSGDEGRDEEGTDKWECFVPVSRCCFFLVRGAKKYYSVLANLQKRTQIFNSHSTEIEQQY